MIETQGFFGVGERVTLTTSVGVLETSLILSGQKNNRYQVKRFLLKNNHQKNQAHKRTIFFLWIQSRI